MKQRINENVCIGASDISLRDLKGDILFYDVDGQEPDISLSANPLNYKQIKVYAAYYGTDPDNKNYGLYEATVFPKITPYGSMLISLAGQSWGMYVYFRFELQNNKLKKIVVSDIDGNNGSWATWWNTNYKIRVYAIIGYKY